MLRWNSRQSWNSFGLSCKSPVFVCLLIFSWVVSRCLPPGEKSIVWGKLGPHSSIYLRIGVNGNSWKRCSSSKDCKPLGISSSCVPPFPKLSLVSLFLNLGDETYVLCSVWWHRLYLRERPMQQLRFISYYCKSCSQNSLVCNLKYFLKFGIPVILI